jgi:DNA-binding CsgD family transcriptional regulator
LVSARRCSRPWSTFIAGPVDTTARPKAPSPPAAGLGLTRREAEVLVLVAEGRTNRQIGQALFITPKTARVHASRILAKLRVAGRGEAAAIAHRLGLDKHRSASALAALPRCGSGCG